VNAPCASVRHDVDVLAVGGVSQIDVGERDGVAQVILADTREMLALPSLRVILTGSPSVRVAGGAAGIRCRRTRVAVSSPYPLVTTFPSPSVYRVRVPLLSVMTTPTPPNTDYRPSARPRS
jgi:hypothetical protein